jgi:hypothetical protein
MCHVDCGLALHVSHDGISICIPGWSPAPSNQCRVTVLDHSRWRGLRSHHAALRRHMVVWDPEARYAFSLTGLVAPSREH